MSFGLVVTCEHGGNEVPATYASLFRGRDAQRALDGHRGSDIGALGVARALAAHFDTPLLAATVTRLLVDLNRSRGHPRLFSEFTRGLEPRRRTDILARYYDPYRLDVRRAIETVTGRGAVALHVSVHSFAPQLGAQTRNADIALLYDPRRTPERALCAAWKALLRDADGALRLRRNYPYRGAADGLTTALRCAYPPEGYLGIELELNQRLLRDQADRAAAAVTASLARLLEA